MDTSLTPITDKRKVVETITVTDRHMKLAFAVVGSLIECGTVPLPDTHKNEWQNGFAVILSTVANALASAGVE